MCAVSVPERVVGITRAVLVADEPVEPQRAETVLASGTPEASVTLARPGDVVTLGIVLAGTLLSAQSSVRANGAFLLAPDTAQGTSMGLDWAFTEA